jgi:hypothetical protein
VRYFGVYITKEEMYIITEYLAGGSLDRLLLSDADIPKAELISMYVITGAVVLTTRIQSY